MRARDYPFSAMNEPPEIAELLRRKQERKRLLAKLSFEEKIEIIERLRELQFNRSLMLEHRLKSEDKGGGMRDE
jgi:hypothetical protein